MTQYNSVLVTKQKHDVLLSIVLSLGLLLLYVVASANILPAKSSPMPYWVDNNNKYFSKNKEFYLEVIRGKSNSLLNSLTSKPKEPTDHCKGVCSGDTRQGTILQCGLIISQTKTLQKKYWSQMMESMS